MALYYFHLHECGSVWQDDEGREFAGIDEAIAAATAGARDVMSHEIRAGKLCLSCYVEIAGLGGTEIARVPFRDAIKLSGLPH